MSVFSLSDFADHEQVVFCSDDKSGLKAIIAVHNPTSARRWAVAACGPMPAKRRRSATCCACRAA